MVFAVSTSPSASGAERLELQVENGEMLRPQQLEKILKNRATCRSWKNYSEY